MDREEIAAEFKSKFNFLPFFRKDKINKLKCKVSELPGNIIDIPEKVKFLIKKNYFSCKCEIINYQYRSYPLFSLFVVIVPNWRRDSSRKVSSVNFYLVAALDEDEAYGIVALQKGKYITKKSKVSVTKVIVTTKRIEKEKIQMNLNFAG